MKRLFVHIGMPKSGSSFLQERLLPHLESRGQLSFINVQRCTEALRRLGFEDPSTFDPIRFRESIAPWCHKEVTVISAEWLSGSILHKSFNRASVAQKIRVALPDAEIVLILRNQVSLLVSAYKQYIHQGGVLPLRSFVGFDGSRIQDGYQHKHYRFDDHRPSLPSLHYDPLFNAYDPYERSGRFHVRLFEAFARDPMAFARDLTTTLAIDPSFCEGLDCSPVNRGYDKAQVTLAMRLNRLVSSPYNPYGMHIPNPRRPSTALQAAHVLQSRISFRLLGGARLSDSALEDAILEYYSEGNRRLVHRLEPALQESFMRYYTKDDT